MWQHTIDRRVMVDDVGRAYRNAGLRITQTAQHHYSFPRLSPALLNDRANAIIQLDPDALFVWVATVSSKRQGGFHTSVAGLGLQITDMQTRYSFAGPDLLPSEALTGSAESPYILGFPYIFAPGSRVRADVIHLSGGGFSAAPGTTAVLFDLSLVGVKLWTVPYTRDVIQPEH